MFKLKIYCNDGDIQYWDDGIGTYNTYEEALIACYKNAINEAQELMMHASCHRWFEVCSCFEITEPYQNEMLTEDIVYFAVAVLFYDHAPWDRENDCDIQIVTGYDIVEIRK